MAIRSGKDLTEEGSLDSESQIRTLPGIALGLPIHPRRFFEPSVRGARNTALVRTSKESATLVGTSGLQTQLYSGWWQHVHIW